ncbi:MAG: TatD family hydrolase [Acidimicrobiales bacterium]
MTSALGQWQAPPGAGPHWFDSHCHLQDTYRLQSTAEADALAQAADAGVSGLVCIGTDAESSLQAVELVERSRLAATASGGGRPCPQAWATVGLHPHEARRGVEETERVLTRVLAEQPGTVVAVGECGLDFHYEHSPRPAQRDAFSAQIELARRHELALVVHTRDAWDETLDLLRDGTPERVVLHCFTGGVDEARRCLDLGAFLSFSGIVTFKNAQDVRDAAAICPLDRLLIETDAPFLAPVPHRGVSNHPGLLPLVGEAVAAVKGVSLSFLADSSTSAALSAFALS